MTDFEILQDLIDCGNLILASALMIVIILIPVTKKLRKWLQNFGRGKRSQD